MSWYPRFRDVHLWVGLIVMAPILVIAATGIGLNHEESLGLKGLRKDKKDKGESHADAGMKEKGTHSEQHGKGEKSAGRGKRADGEKKGRKNRGDAVAVAEGPDAQTKTEAARFDTAGSAWTQQATGVDEAVAQARAMWGRDVALERIEMKYEESAGGLVVKVKAAKTESVEPDELVWSVAGHERLLRPEDRPASESFAGVNWAKVTKDLHTGKFFSKAYGYWWSDIAAGALLLLSGTGLVLYAIPALKKRKKKRTMAAVPVAKAGVATARPPIARPRPIPVAETTTAGV